MPTPRFSPWLRVVIFGLGAVIASGILSAVVIKALSVSLARSGRAASGGLGEYALWISALSYPLLWMWLVFCRRSYDRRPVRALGLRAQDRGRALVGGGVAGAFAVAWLFGVLWLCGGVIFNGFSPEVLALQPLGIIGQLALYALLFAAVGFVEETIFRGYLLHNFGAAMGLRAAIWLQALGFALVHLGNLGASGAMPTSAQWIDTLRAMPSLALIGAIFALCWAKSGTLWYSIGFHAAWNFALGCVFSLPVSGLHPFRLFDIAPVGSAWLNGGNFGAEGSVLLWPILGALWLIVQRLPDHPQALHDLESLTQRAPQVLAARKNVMIPENQPENSQTQPRSSRFQTSMRAAREADEASSGEIPILGQLPRPNETAPIATATVDFSPAVPSRATQKNQPTEMATTTSTEFQFRPLPTAPQVLAAPATSVDVVVDAPIADKNAEIVTPKIATPAGEMTDVETPAPETPEPVRKRPSPRW